jgi:16S rRNA (uracil1498-N3)-methyltransferase
MHRFFCLSPNIKNKEINIIDKNLVHYIRDVLRLKAQEELVIFDEKAFEYNCRVIDVSKKISLRILDQRAAKKQPSQVSLTIACAIPKMTKMDDIVDKLTQLGVDRIIPMEAERVIMKLDKDKKIAKHKRWEKIALSATQQSQRTYLPIVEPIQDIHEVLHKTQDFDLKLIPVLIGERKSLKDVFSQSQPQPKSIIIFIGPEGDFTPNELDYAKKHGFIPVSLGDLVLRVDTAAIAVSSYIKLNRLNRF